jgi:hypothetical protein
MLDNIYEKKTLETRKNLPLPVTYASTQNSGAEYKMISR